jgi:hypothetical protein
MLRIEPHRTLWTEEAFAQSFHGVLSVLSVSLSLRIQRLILERVVFHGSDRTDRTLADLFVGLTARATALAHSATATALTSAYLAWLKQVKHLRNLGSTRRVSSLLCDTTADSL